MHDFSDLHCPICNDKNFILRYEAKYVYSYIIDSDSPGLNNNDQFASFLYDSREQKESKQYVECNSCGTKYLYQLNDKDKGIDSTSLSNIIDIKNIITKS